MRITIDPAVCTGKPCIRGLGFPVARLLGLLAAGESRETILVGYPYLEPEDIDEALRYLSGRGRDGRAGRVRFLVDMPLSPALAHWLTAGGHDTAHAAALGLQRAPDTEILARAAQDKRTIIKADLDYPRILALAGASGSSLILFRGGDWSEAEIIARMQQVLQTLSETDVVHSIIVVERVRVRRRRLPIS
jgi:uncharacterized protein (DUF433 family)/predicted nuclease of predicted toxin-antitoxin system